MNWLKVLVGPATDLFNDWRKRRHEIKLAKHELKMTRVEAEVDVAKAQAQARIDMEAAKLTGALNWELLSIQNSGWKDEYITLLFTIPAVAIFVPHLQDYVFAGFKHLGETPFWYQVVLMGIVGSALGVRIWDQFTKPLRLRKEATNA